jgi:hypothetical protein
VLHLAHFTSAEMPVTLAILLAGVIIGFAVGLVVARGTFVSRDRRPK